MLAAVVLYPFPFVEPVPIDTDQPHQHRQETPPLAQAGGRGGGRGHRQEAAQVGAGPRRPPG